MPTNDMESFMRDFQQQPEKTLRRFLALQGKGDARYKDVVRQLRIAQHNTDHAIQWGLEVLKSTDLRADLGLIDVPVHVLHGKQDAVVPVAAAESFHPLLKSAAETWEASGHAPFLSEPERFAHWLEQRIR